MLDENPGSGCVRVATWEALASDDAITTRRISWIRPPAFYKVKDPPGDGSAGKLAEKNRLRRSGRPAK